MPNAAASIHAIGMRHAGRSARADVCTTGMGPVSSSTVGTEPVVATAPAGAPESRSTHERAPRSRRMCTPHSATPTRASTPHDIRARGQPTTAAIGAVPIAASSEPTLSIAVYPAVTIVTRSGGTSRRMITGITTLPTVIAMPMISMPASIHPNPGIERTSVPTSTPHSVNRTATSAPARRTRSAASGVNAAKASTGTVVMSPAVDAVSTRSSAMLPSTGVGATMGPRMLTAATSTPITTSQGMRRERVAGVDAAITPA